MGTHQLPEPSAAVLEGLPGPLRVWLKPVEPMLGKVIATRDKPLAELTMPEVLSWCYVIAYCMGTGMIAARLAANTAAVILHGPMRR